MPAQSRIALISQRSPCCLIAFFNGSLRGSVVKSDSCWQERSARGDVCCTVRNQVEGAGERERKKKSSVAFFFLFAAFCQKPLGCFRAHVKKDGKRKSEQCVCARACVCLPAVLYEQGFWQQVLVSEHGTRAAPHCELVVLDSAKDVGGVVPGHAVNHVACRTRHTLDVLCVCVRVCTHPAQ